MYPCQPSDAATAETALRNKPGAVAAGNTVRTLTRIGRIGRGCAKSSPYIGGRMSDRAARRPESPDALYEAFLDHWETCPDCTPQGECPTGSALLHTWGAVEVAAKPWGAVIAGNRGAR